MSATSARVSTGSLFELVVEGLLTVDLPGADPSTVRMAAVQAADHAEGMPDVTRLGVRLAGGVLVIALMVPARGHLARVGAERRGRLLNRVARVPLVGDYLRLARGLGLACYHDRVSP